MKFVVKNKSQQITQITQITTSVKSVKSDVKKGTTEDTEDTEKSVKSVKSVEKKVENNKSTFYLKINGFLFGGLKNNHYLCISERNKY